MNFIQKMFCKHNNKLEKNRYYKKYWKEGCLHIDAHKIYQCQDCLKYIDDKVLDFLYVSSMFSDYDIEMLRTLKYKEYEFMVLE